MLKAEHIYFRYGRDSEYILEDVDFSVEAGERVALLAPSGFGKSTLAKLLAGLLQPTKGSVTLDGRPLSRTGVCPVQLIFQHPEKAVNPLWTMEQVLEEAGKPDEALLDALGIEKAWLGRSSRTLSGGELQRFCVARAMLAQPQFLICDEISTMLDVITQAQIWNRILEEASKRNMGLVVVTHNPALARRLCTRVTDLTVNCRKTAEGETEL